MANGRINEKILWRKGRLKVVIIDAVNQNNLEFVFVSWTALKSSFYELAILFHA